MWRLYLCKMLLYRLLCRLSRRCFSSFSREADSETSELGARRTLPHGLPYGVPLRPSQIAHREPFGTSLNFRGVRVRESHRGHSRSPHRGRFELVE